MNKENVVKKILVKSLVGFPVGVTLLMLAYISIYYISGENVFNSELYQLHNIKTLIFQILSTGISGYLLFITFYTFSHLQNEEFKNKLSTKHQYKSIFTIITIFVFIVLITMEILGNTKLFSKNISNLCILIFVIVYALGSLTFCIKDVSEKFLIKEINNKLKERNNK